MSGLMQSTFQNLRKHYRLIDFDYLIVGAGGGGAGGGSYLTTSGYGGSAGHGASLESSSSHGVGAGTFTIFASADKICTDIFTYSVTAGSGGAGGTPGYSGGSGYTGGTSSLSGRFGSTTFNSFTTRSAPGGAGGSGFSASTNTGPAANGYWNLYYIETGDGGNPVYYRSGASAGETAGWRNGVAATGGGAGGPGGGGGISQAGYQQGGYGGGGGPGTIIIRCKTSDYTSYTTNAVVTTIVRSSIPYSVFKWTYSGSITFFT